jgi:hypothetical protein
MQPTRTEAIKRFLTAMTHADLANLYNANMECQINVAQDGGTRIDSTFQGRSSMAYTDGSQTWRPIRIPRNAGTDPEYKDLPMSWDLSAHAEAIGMTGWDWTNRVSRWVAFDFDAIVGHSTKHTRKSTDEELLQIRQLLQGVPWVSLRYSTGGKGLHLYVFVNEIETQNHHEHAALARSILGQLSAHVGYDFSSRVDICGGNMWVWHRKMQNTNGLLLIKESEPFEDVPHNWKEHIPVVKGNRRKTLPSIVQGGTEEDLFDALTTKSPQQELEPDHRKHIEWLNDNGAYWYWDQDRNMLVTHTWFLKRMHEELQLKGPFETNSIGSERGSDHNCFCFPLRKGAWAVRRFTPGVAEHPSWNQDGAGWTRTFLNRDPDFRTLAQAHGGNEKGSGGFHFTDAKAALDTVVALGAEVTLPSYLMNRKTILRQRKDNKIVIQVERDPGDTGDKMEGWIPEPKKWERVLSTRVTAPSEPELGDFDEVVRHIVTQEFKDAGLLVKVGNHWTEEPLPNIKMSLKAQGHNPADVDVIVGSTIMKHWILVNQPFGDEYPGGRYWNRNSAQFLIRPSKDKEVGELTYPTWLKLLNHLGTGLNEEILAHPWCINNGILNGGDYLKCWVASLLQSPMEQLPYLFFYSEHQNTGKSSFHEAIGLLLSHGSVVKAEIALTSEASFSGELASAILCVVEEIDLGKGRGKSLAYNRIKDWVTAKTFMVHPKSKTPYTIPNSTHWVQCANSYTACPIFPGDTRITMIYVEDIDPLELIPKTTFLELLRAEGADFLAAVLSLDLPRSNDRLNVPVINTQFKEQASRQNVTLLETFIQEECFEVDGEWIKFSDFYERFISWLGGAEDKVNWSKHKVRNEIPPKFPYGASYISNQRYVCNLSFSAREGPVKPKITTREGHLLVLGERI